MTAHILYIDDDEGLCRLARRALTAHGHEVAVATGGAQGVAMAMAEPFDLIALDHYMPGQDGLETLAALMALPSPPPVIYVTGSEESSVAVAALKAGAADYVVKSASADFFDLLARTIDQALAARKLRAEKELAEQQLRETNAQLEMMLGEVNHRVANSLQLVSAFVDMQARRATGEEARALLADTRRRIQAIAQVHRQLYVAGGMAIEMAQYVHALAADLEQTCSTPASPRRIGVTADNVTLPVGMAVSLGIVINELVCNACKYAYPEGQSGEVRIAFTSASPGAFILTVEDDGIGMANDTADMPPQGTGLGSQIVRAMAQSLEAELIYTGRPRGLRVSLVRKSD